MFKIGEKVIHSSCGVCEICDIRKESFTGETKTYYMLKSLDGLNKCVIYIPVDSPHNQIRYIKTPEEIEKTIESSRGETVEWINESALRKAAFSDVLKNEPTQRVIAMICCIYNKKEELESIGKRLTPTDQRFLEEAQKKVHQEFSYGLNIREEDVAKYVVEILAKAK